MIPRIATCLSTALFLAATPAAGTQNGAGERMSLEQLLERCRAERDALLGELRSRVELAVQDVKAAVASGKKPEIEGALARIVELGAPSAPLLVPILDPGLAPEESKVLSARLVARALREFRSPAITGELLTLLQRGGPEGRRNALRVLAVSPDAARVAPEIRALFPRMRAEERLAALEALAELGGPENESFLGEQLGSDDRQLVADALAALARTASQSAAPRVLALAKTPAAAAPHARSILDYYRAVPTAVDGEVCGALLQLVQSGRVSAQDSVRLLEILPEHQRQWPSSMKRDLRALADGSEQAVGEAALVALVRAGDRAARRDLFAPYDQRVADQRNWPRVWEDRGALHYRVENYRAAIKDYQEALRLSRDGGRSQAEAHVQVARCHARMDKLKEARDWLELAPLSVSELRALANDPAFAALAQHARYRDVFRLE